jgi:enamine deaminase RidA (YjgF/YER057c/UK114 family)
MSNIKEQPIPQGKYLPAVRHRDLIYTSGMTPRKAGKLIHSGKIKVSDPIESLKEAVELSAVNALAAARACLNENERISSILQLNVFLNAEETFTSHANVADFASDVLIENLGSDCIGSRVAVGVASLPSNAPVEISMTALVV